MARSPIGFRPTDLSLIAAQRVLGRRRGLSPTQVDLAAGEAAAKLAARPPVVARRPGEVEIAGEVQVTMVLGAAVGKGKTRTVYNVRTTLTYQAGPGETITDIDFRAAVVKALAKPASPAVRAFFDAAEVTLREGRDDARRRQAALELVRAQLVEKLAVHDSQLSRAFGTKLLGLFRARTE